MRINKLQFYLQVITLKVAVRLLMLLAVTPFLYCASGGNYEITRSQLGGVSGSILSSADVTLQRAFSQPIIVGVKNQNGFYLINGYLYLTTENPRVIALSPAHGSYALSISTVIKVYFENEISPLTLQDAIKVYEKRDNTASLIYRPIAINTVYSSSENSVTISPQSGSLKNNYLYLVIVSTALSEPEENLTLEDEVKWGFSTIASKSVANVFEYDYNPSLKVEVPPNVMPVDEYYILMSTDPMTLPVKVLPESILIANAKAIKQDETRRVSEYYEISALDNKFTPVNKLDGAVNVILPFQSAKKFKAMAASYPNLKVKRKYNLYYLDEEKKLWLKVPGVQVDTTEGIIKGALPYLGTFSVIADPDYDLTTAYAFPVPYSPNENPNHKNIIFADLATKCTIKIFTITGELVQEFEYDANSAPKPYYEWDVKNKDGVPVASGVYFYLIESPKDRKLGKLMIIR